MLKKIVSVLLAIAVCVFLAPTAFAQEIEGKEYVGINELVDGANARKLYSVERITDVQALERRAENGVDDLKQRTGIEIECGTTKPDDVKASIKYTSQLMSIVEYDGELFEEYGIAVISDYTREADDLWDENVSSERTQYNYRLVNYIYFLVNSASTYSYYEKSLTTFYTVGNVSATPTSLRVTNGVTLDIISYPELYPQEGYEISKSFSSISANNPYILGSPYSGKIMSSYFAGLYTDARLTLSDGTSVSSYCQVSP